MKKLILTIILAFSVNVLSSSNANISSMSSNEILVSSCTFVTVEFVSSPFGAYYDVTEYSTSFYEAGSDGCSNWQNTMFNLWYNSNFGFNNL